MLPCLVPQEWIVPPACDVDGDGSSNDLEELESDERSMMIQPVQRTSSSNPSSLCQDGVDTDDGFRPRFRGASLNGGTCRNTDERVLPPSEAITA